MPSYVNDIDAMRLAQKLKSSKVRKKRCKLSSAQPAPAAHLCHHGCCGRSQLLLGPGLGCLSAGVSHPHHAIILSLTGAVLQGQRQQRQEERGWRIGTDLRRWADLTCSACSHTCCPSLPPCSEALGRTQAHSPQQLATQVIRLRPINSR